MITYMPLILVGVLLNAGAQLLLKEGMTRIGHFSFSFNNIWPIGLQVAASPFIMAGLFSYVISVLVWLLVLSRVDVSFAYPMISIGYVVTAIAAYFLLNEPLTVSRIIGTFVIIFGVWLITKT